MSKTFAEHVKTINQPHDPFGAVMQKLDLLHARMDSYEDTAKGNPPAKSSPDEQLAKICDSIAALAKRMDAHDARREIENEASDHYAEVDAEVTDEMHQARMAELPECGVEQPKKSVQLAAD